MIGFSICIIGLALCFFGSELIKISFIMLCILTINMFLLELFQTVFGFQIDKNVGYSVLVSLISIPSGYYAGKLGDNMAVPFITSLTGFIIAELILDMMLISDDYFVKTIMELISAMGGFYIGQQYKDQIKVLVTALLGGILSVLGFSIAIRIWPMTIKNKEALLTNLFLTLALAFAGYCYQMNKITRMNKRLSTSDSMNSSINGEAVTDSQKRLHKINNHIEKTVNKNGSFWRGRIFNDTSFLSNLNKHNGLYDTNDNGFHNESLESILNGSRAKTVNVSDIETYAPNPHVMDNTRFNEDSISAKMGPERIHDPQSIFLDQSTLS